METSVAVAGDVEFVSACPVCHGQSFTRLPVPGRWVGPEVFGDLSSQLGLVRCRACSLVFTNPRPSATRLKTFYSGETYVCHEEDASHFARNKADLLLRKLGELMPAGAPRTLLDYGAGAGGFLVHARTQGWDVKGFEPGKRGLETCRRASLDVTDDLRSLPSRAFGLITLQHVFEHLADPAATLQSLRTYLAPEGRLYIEVPNARSLRASAAAPFLSRRFAVDERYRAFPVHLMYSPPPNARQAARALRLDGRVHVYARYWIGPIHHSTTRERACGCARRHSAPGRTDTAATRQTSGPRRVSWTGLRGEPGRYRSALIWCGSFLGSDGTSRSYTCGQARSSPRWPRCRFWTRCP